jgi:hypothetical protein
MNFEEITNPSSLVQCKRSRTVFQNMPPVFLSGHLSFSLVHKDKCREIISPPSKSFPIHHAPYNSTQGASIKQAVTSCWFLAWLTHRSWSRGHIFLHNVDWISLFNHICVNLRSYTLSRFFWSTECCVYRLRNSNKKEIRRRRRRHIDNVKITYA